MAAFKRTTSRSRRLESSQAPLQPQLPYRNLDQILHRVSGGFFSHAYDNASWCFAIQPTLASITRSTRLIRIHNILNAPDVPDEVFEMIIFHEMLHLEFPPARRLSGSWDAHPPAFRKAERARCPSFDISWGWLHANLPLHRRTRLQCTDVVPRVLRLTRQQRAWARDRFSIALPAVLRADEPWSRRINPELWRIAIAARYRISGGCDALAEVK